jgi:hypothetical protein
MCDPLIGGLIAGAASLGAGAMQASQLADVQSKQQEANNQWVAYQTRIHQQQVTAEDTARQTAENARQQTLSQVTPQAQQQQQQTEQQRLNALYTDPSGKSAGASGTSPSDPNAMLLTGEQSGTQASKDNLMSQVNQATTQARSRIAALATASSYGGSFGGLGTMVPINFMQGSNAINLQNDIRQGNLKTYGVQQQVQPIQYAIGPGTDMMGGIAKSLAGMAGSLGGYGAAGAWGGGGSATDGSVGGVGYTGYGPG